MLRNKALSTFDTRLQKALQQSAARRQRKVREAKDRREELLEDLEFDRIHKVAELRQKASDPLYQFNRLATQVLNDPENAEELRSQEIVASHRQSLVDVQQVYANAQAKRAEELAQAKAAYGMFARNWQ